MASVGLRGQNGYAYCTSNTILRLVFETKFCPKINGLGVKVEQTHRHFSQFLNIVIQILLISNNSANTKFASMYIRYK